MFRYLILPLFFLLPVFPVFAQPSLSAQERADAVVQAMGGAGAWEQTRYLTWNFFGRRQLTWDKWGERVRIDFPQDTLSIILSIPDKTGMVRHRGREITHPDTLAFWLDRAYKIWINDSYWLIMPFKLRDPGVNLAYLGRVPHPLHAEVDILELTFNGVGVTPENKYWVSIDPVSNLVVEWAYFEKYTDASPQIVTPWDQYSRFGRILLSTGRGEKRQLTKVGVFDFLPVTIWESLDPIPDILALGR